MIIKRENDKIVIDFKNTILYTFNDIGLHVKNNDIDDKIEIRNIHIFGGTTYSQLVFIEKVKLLYRIFKIIFLNKE